MRIFSTFYLIMAKVISPRWEVCAPSAIVFGGGIETMRPSLRDYYASLPASGSTPITLHFGDSFYAASEHPEISPPPPTQTNK